MDGLDVGTMDGIVNEILMGVGVEGNGGGIR